MTAPQLIKYATIDTLLEGYRKEPLISETYLHLGPEDEEKITQEMLSRLKPSSKLDAMSSWWIGALLGEALRNIHQHCCGKSDVKFYVSGDMEKLIGAFELNEESQFGKDGHGRYLVALDAIYAKSLSSAHNQQLTDFLFTEDQEEPDGLSIGTIIIMHHPNVKRVGVADIEGRAYFFFEYQLGQG